MRIKHLSTSLTHCVATSSLTGEPHTCFRVTRVVPLVWRYIDFGTNIAGKDVVSSVVLLIKYSRSDERSYTGVIVNLFQASTLVVAVIVHIDDVETCTALVSLTCSIYISFETDSVLLELLLVIHDVESLLLTFKSLFPQVENFGLLLIHYIGSHFLICFVEGLVKTILLVNKMRRGGVRTEYFG